MNLIDFRFIFCFFHHRKSIQMFNLNEKINTKTVCLFHSVWVYESIFYCSANICSCLKNGGNSIYLFSLLLPRKQVSEFYTFRFEFYSVNINSSINILSNIWHMLLSVFTRLLASVFLFEFSFHGDPRRRTGVYSGWNTPPLKRDADYSPLPNSWMYVYDWRHIAI